MITLLDRDTLKYVISMGSNLHDNFSSLYNYDSLNTGVNKTFVLSNENKEYIGFIHIQILEGEVDIIDVYISNEYRRRGYAKQLITYIFDQFIADKYILEVSSKNTPAINLYNKMGFKEIGVRKNYYKDSDAILMERK